MKAQLQKEATILRKKGLSIKSISKKLGVSQSTMSRWCKDIVLSKTQSEKLNSYRKEAGMHALRPWIELRKQEREQDISKQIKNGKADVGSLSRRDLFLLGLGLYWGEGYKRGSQELGFTNSDPNLIKTYLEWIKTFYDVDKSRFIARVTINEKYRFQTNTIQEYWSKITEIPLTQFTKPSYISSSEKSGHRNPDTYKGTLRIKVRKGTSLRRRILGSIQEVQDQISPNSRKTFSNF